MNRFTSTTFLILKKLQKEVNLDQNIFVVTKMVITLKIRAIV
jgi:hypothetical protein